MSMFAPSVCPRCDSHSDTMYNRGNGEGWLCPSCISISDRIRAEERSLRRWQLQAAALSFGATVLGGFIGFLLSSL